MFERFTNRARHVIVLSQEEARRLQHNYIGTEHILLGLLGEPEGLAGQVLDGLGMSLEGVREQVKTIIGVGTSSVGGHIPFTPRAKKVLELALREALQLRHDYIGTEHILLGLIREGDGVGVQILKQDLGDLNAVRMAVIDALPAGTSEVSRARRWLHRRSAADLGETPEAGEQAEFRTTPAADTSLSEAARLAGSRPVGSHHLLLAALADPDTAAARALAALGVDLDQAKEALRTADVTGTSDEQPEEAGRRQMLIRVTDERLTVEATDPIIVKLGRAALDALDDGERGEDAPGEKDNVIRGDQPGSASLSNLWQALHDSLEAIGRRAAPALDAAPAPDAAPARDPGQPDREAL